MFRCSLIFFCGALVLCLIRLGHRRGGKLRSFFSCAIAPNTFLRELPLTLSVSSSAWSWQMLIYLVRIPRRRGHSNQSIVRFNAVGNRIHGGARVGLYGRDLNPPWRIGSRHLQLPPFSTDISRYRLVSPRGGPVHVSARLVLVSSNSRPTEIAETAAVCGAMGEES